MRDNASLFGLPQSLIDAVKEVQESSAEYQNKVKAHMAKKGIKSLGDLSPEEKKKFFNDLDAAHKAKNEEKKMKDDEDEMEDDEEEEDDDEMEMKKKGKKKEIEESDLPSSKEKQKTVMVVHKTSGKELKIQASALDKYKAMGYKLMEEVKDVEEAESHQSKTTMKHISKPTAGEKKAAKDIKPGIAGYRDRVAMLKSAKARGALKEDGTEIEEAKSGTGYQLYHKDFSSAMAHAYDFAKQKYNIEIDPMEIDRNVAMGPKKPSSGKSNAYRLLDKTGKKAIQVQVANLDNKRYELNMYKEEVDIEEARVKGKGYDNPENERKAPEGKVPFTSFQQGKQGDLAARLHATSAKGKLVKGKAQSAPQKESYELTPEDIEFINSLNEKQ